MDDDDIIINHAKSENLLKSIALNHGIMQYKYHKNNGKQKQRSKKALNKTLNYFYKMGLGKRIFKLSHGTIMVQDQDIFWHKL